MNFQPRRCWLLLNVLVVSLATSRVPASQIGSVVSERQLIDVLRQPAVELDLPGETALQDVIRIIEQQMGQISGLPVQIVVDQVALELEALDASELVVKDVLVRPGTHTFGEVFNMITRQFDPKLAIVPRDGHILLTTEFEAESQNLMSIRVYDLTSLLNASSGRLQQSMATQPGRPDFAGKPLPQVNALVQQLIRLIVDCVNPDGWIEVGGDAGQVSIVGQRLVIVQSHQAHCQIEKLFSDLSNPMVIHSPSQAVNDVAQQTHSLDTNVALMSIAIAGWVVAFLLAIAYVVSGANRRMPATDP